MMSKTPWIAAASLLVALSGCGNDGYYYDRSYEYKNAEMVAPLELPDSARQGAVQDAMPVPKANSDYVRPQDGFDVPRPQPKMSEQAAQSFVQMRGERGQQWLLVNAAPNAVWPKLQRFVAATGYRVSELDASQGLIKTTDGTLSVRQGVRGGSSEVRCDQNGAANSDCLSRLSTYLTQNAGNTGEGVSLVGQNLSNDSNVILRNRQGQWQVVVQQDFASIWSELDYQLKREFDTDDARLVDQDRSQRRFTVDYLPSEASGSGWWIFGSDPEPKRYQLQIDTDNGQSIIHARRDDGSSIETSAARELLDRVASLLR
ncbi:outer membrane protein assembly factor BamC [Larsenimonas suaedae]|uniref:Outer membrane protein assembly factor BamC n=1 Tax=Larsenimonas suaedae TaxID=1851019 RepID=A0ABU1GTU3_9GAMM|nr:outer membrane protein assembly factor BamC [Larsenimonas suaedae]MCM2971892.1 outer membrane protein assembly factor BamC [Larsenimonas suaedae]MDR5895444.1 outer membrane protein assembly factor BamC [Larsenimonas suaedae]